MQYRTYLDIDNDTLVYYYQGPYITGYQSTNGIILQWCSSIVCVVCTYPVQNADKDSPNDSKSWVPDHWIWQRSRSFIPPKVCNQCRLDSEGVRYSLFAILDSLFGIPKGLTQACSVVQYLTDMYICTLHGRYGTLHDRLSFPTLPNILVYTMIRYRISIKYL